MTALRELFASFFVEFDKEGALAKGDKAVDGLAAHVLDFGKTVAAAFAAREVIGFVGDIINAADNLRDQTKKLRVPAEWLQGWQHAAGLAGSSEEGFTSAFTKFNKNVAEAAENAKGPAAEAFKTLGVSAEDVKNKLPAELFDMFVAGLEGIDNPAKRTSLSMALLGKSGADLLPLLSEGSDAIAKMRGEVAELGAGFEQDFLDQADDFNDNVGRLKLGLRGLAIQAIGPLLPDLVKGAQATVGWVKQIVGWVRQTRLIQAAILALKVKGVLTLIRLVPVLIAKVGGLRVALMRLGAFAFRVLIPFLLLEDVIVFLSGGKSAIGRNLDRIFGAGTQQKVLDFIKVLGEFVGKFKSSPDEVRGAFKDLPRDLQKDLGGFGAFLGGWGQSIVEVGLFAADTLTGGWENAGRRLIGLWVGVKGTGVIVWTELKFAGLSAAASISDAFDKAIGFIQNKIGALQGTLGSLLKHLPGFEDLGKELEVAGQQRQERAGAEPTAAQEVSEQWDRARLQIAGDFDEIKRALIARGPDGQPLPPGGAPAVPGKPGAATTIQQSVKQENRIQVTNQIAPGTPDEQVAAIGSATTKGVRSGIDTKQLRAALVPTPG